MKCTSCKQGLLAPVQLDDLFPAHACTHCGGNWIYLHDYLRWLDQDGGIDAADSDYRVVSVITIIDVVMFTLFDGLVESARRLQGSRGSRQWCS